MLRAKHEEFEFRFDAEPDKDQQKKCTIDDKFKVILTRKYDTVLEIQEFTKKTARTRTDTVYADTWLKA